MTVIGSFRHGALTYSAAVDFFNHWRVTCPEFSIDGGEAVSRAKAIRCAVAALARLHTTALWAGSPVSPIAWGPEVEP